MDVFSEKLLQIVTCVNILNDNCYQTFIFFYNSSIFL